MHYPSHLPSEPVVLDHLAHYQRSPVVLPVAIAPVYHRLHPKTVPDTGHAMHPIFAAKPSSKEPGFVHRARKGITKLARPGQYDSPSIPG